MWVSGTMLRENGKRESLQIKIQQKALYDKLQGRLDERLIALPLGWLEGKNKCWGLLVALLQTPASSSVFAEALLGAQFLPLP